MLESESEYDKIYIELKQWFRRLKEAYEGDEITEDEGQKLAKISRLILNQITQKLEHSMAERALCVRWTHVSDDRSGEVSAVGGKELELPGDREIIAAIKKGLRQGREEERGKLEKRMRESAKELLLCGVSPEDISRCLGLNLDDVLNIQKKAAAKRKASIAEA